MINNILKFPFYIKVSIFFIGLLAFLTILYIAQSIIVPLIFAFIIAILLHPVVNFFVRIKIKRIVAISIIMLFTFLVFASVGFFFVSQAISFADSWPILVDKFTEILNQSITMASGYFNVSPNNIHEWVKSTKDELIYINTSGIALSDTLTTIGNSIMVLLLIPVYVFLILFYHPLLIEFIHRLFSANNQKKVSTIVSKIKILVQRYLIGLVIEGILVAILNSIALFALGIEYAILLGVIGALLNVIPYIGGIVGVALPMVVALVTKSSGWYSLYVLGLYYIIQLIDNNYIVPIIVASKVKISALFSIIVVLVGNALWGISGMFLSIPLLAITKLIFDHLNPLKPWGFLLGDTMPPLLKIKPFFNKKKTL